MFRTTFKTQTKLPVREKAIITLKTGNVSEIWYEYEFTDAPYMMEVLAPFGDALVRDYRKSRKGAVDW